MNELSPEGKILFYIATLKKEGKLTPEEVDSLKGMVKENDDQMKLIKENLEYELYAKEYLITLVRPTHIPDFGENSAEPVPEEISSPLGCALYEKRKRMRQQQELDKGFKLETGSNL